MQYLRTNLFIASWTLILLAAGISVGLPGASGLAIAAPLGIAGSLMLIWAISMREEPKGMSDKEISKWTLGGCLRSIFASCPALSRFVLSALALACLP